MNQLSSNRLNSLWCKSGFRNGKRLCDSQGSFVESAHGDGHAQAAGKARGVVDRAAGAGGGAGASVLREAERVAGGRALRRVGREPVREVLCSQVRASVADACPSPCPHSTNHPCASHNLFRSPNPDLHHGLLGILSEGEFFGEGGLAGQPLRMGSATAMTDCELLQIDKKAMMLALRREHTFSDLFVAYLVARNIRYEEDLVDQLFNSSEKRLARALLLLAHFGKEGVPESVIPKITQETLAEMVGTTRSRVSFFMNRFRESGFVDYGGSGLQIHSSLLNVVLQD